MDKFLKTVEAVLSRWKERLEIREAIYVKTGPVFGRHNRTEIRESEGQIYLVIDPRISLDPKVLDFKVGHELIYWLIRNYFLSYLKKSIDRTEKDMDKWLIGRFPVLAESEEEVTSKYLVRGYLSYNEEDAIEALANKVAREIYLLYKNKENKKNKAR